MLSDLRLLLTCLPAALVGACIGMDPHEVIHLESRGDAFDRALHAEYAELAVRESARYRWLSATRFAHKAEAAASGDQVLPEMPEILGIPAADADEIERARGRLLVALQRPGVRHQAAPAAAAAQASYDCWVEQAAGGRPGVAEACRARWQTTMADLEVVAPPAVMPAAAPPVRVHTPRRVEVFFQPGSAWLDQTSEERVARLLRDPQVSRAGAIRIIGYTDRVGAADLNEQLAWARAGAVADVLVEAGVGVEQLELLSLGEAAPAVPTADEVPHPRNRRAVIELL